MRLNLLDPHFRIEDIYLTDYDLVSDGRFDIIDYDQWCNCPPRPDPERTFLRLPAPVLVLKDNVPSDKTRDDMDVDEAQLPTRELSRDDAPGSSSSSSSTGTVTYKRVAIPPSLTSPELKRELEARGSLPSHTHPRRHRRVILNPARESVPELEDWQSFLRVMVDVTEGLNAMRANGWLHGDVGPHTCFWDAKEQIGTLSDWDYTTWCYGEPRGVGPRGPQYF